MSKNWSFLTVVLEKTLDSPLDYKKIKSVSPKGNQPWISTGSSDTEAEAPILWTPDGKSRLTGKDLMLGKIEGRRRSQGQKIRSLYSIINSMNTSWANSERQWRIRKPGKLQSWGHRVGHNWITEQQHMYYNTRRDDNQLNRVSQKSLCKYLLE